MQHICHIVGARPNFIKLAPVLHELTRRGHPQTVVHTGQHYDAGMSTDILRELRIHVDCSLNRRTVPLMKSALVETLEKLSPDVVMVYGDVNSTLAGALAADELGIRLAHVESGLRSGDWTMPEEVNRYITDHLATDLFTTCEDAAENLKREGAKAKVVFVGNPMIDTLIKTLPTTPIPFEADYALVTLHRPSNVDNPDRLRLILGHLNRLRSRLIFPKHPRVNLPFVPHNVTVTVPMSYREFIGAIRWSSYVITDSGGVQEETTYLGIPCLTLRDSTERPITVTLGTNALVDGCRLKSAEDDILAGRWKKGAIPPLWDGHAAERIVDYLEKEG